MRTKPRRPRSSFPPERQNAILHERSHPQSPDRRRAAQAPGVVAKKINNLDAYFVSDRMFACISGDGMGLRLPARP